MNLEYVCRKTETVEKEVSARTDNVTNGDLAITDSRIIHICKNQFTAIPLQNISWLSVERRLRKRMIYVFLFLLKFGLGFLGVGLFSKYTDILTQFTPITTPSGQRTTVILAGVLIGVGSLGMLAMYFWRQTVLIVGTGDTEFEFRVSEDAESMVNAVNDL